MQRITGGVLATAALVLTGCQSHPNAPVEPYAIVTLAQEKQFVAPECQGENCAQVRVSALEFPKSLGLTRELRSRLIALAPSERANTPVEGSASAPTWAGYANDFFEQANRHGMPMPDGGASEVLLEADVVGRYNDVLIIELNSDAYFNGQAHGLPATEFMVIDERQARTVGLDDMLIDGREAAFEQLVGEAHQRWLSDIDQDDTFAANWPLSDHRNVAPMEDHWVVKFDVYEIAPYAVGQPELEIPLDALEGIAKPRYLDQ
ncbi:RsiV family protein [Vreelandella sp. EE27]